MRRPLAVTFVGLASCTSCNDGAAVPTDAAPDAFDLAANPHDAAVDTAWWDGGAIADWPGWRRLTEVDPACHVDVPSSTSSLPVVNWIGCTDGRPSCQQIDTTLWNDHKSTINFSAGQLSGGLSYLILIGRPVIDITNPITATAETDFIDVSTWKATAGFRFGGDGANCSGNFTASESFAFFSMQPITNSGPLAIDRRPLSAVGNTTLNFVNTDVNPWTLGQSQTQQMRASDSVLAFDIQPSGLIGRVDGTSTHVTLTSKIQLTYPVVVGADVYAIDQAGTDGWARIMRVNPDGSTTQYRAVPSHRVTTPAGDGTTMYWTECYGDTNPANDTQPNVEMWSAPYTSDPAILASTAQKVATLGTSCVYDMEQLAQNGLFFAATATANYVYRKSDGKVLTFTNGNNRVTWYPLYISQSEYWSVEAAQPGPKGVALTRLQLGAW